MALFCVAGFLSPLSVSWSVKQFLQSSAFLLNHQCLFLSKVELLAPKIVGVRGLTGLVCRRLSVVDLFALGRFSHPQV